MVRTHQGFEGLGGSQLARADGCLPIAWTGDRALSSSYQLRGYRRRIARTVVDVMVPRWDDFKTDLVDDVLDDVENTIRNYPAAVRFGISIMLLFVEFAGPVTFTGLAPLSWLDRRRATIRMERLANHRFALVRSMPKFLKILVCFNAYARQDVEAYLGADRRSWRPDRHRFRESLLQITDGREKPPAPHALSSSELVAPARYLDDRPAVKTPAQVKCEQNT